MSNVVMQRILADPQKVARVLYVLEPFLNVEDYTFKSSAREDISLEELFQYAKESYTDNDRIVNGVIPYRKLHKNIAGNLNRLEEKTVFFITGVSVDQTREGKVIGYDPFSIRNSLTDEILRILKDNEHKFHYEKPFEDLVFFPMSPFFTPFYYENGELIHCFEDLIEQENKELWENGNQLLGLTRKRSEEIDPKEGLWQFNPLLYDACLAIKSMEPWEDQTYDQFTKWVRDSTWFNQHITAVAYANIAKAIGLEGEVDIYASKTGTSRKILELAAKYNGKFRVNEEWGVLDNIKMPHQRELHPTAVKRLERRLLYVMGYYDQKPTKIVL